MAADRYDEIAWRIVDNDDHAYAPGSAKLAESIAAALREVEREERERCAQIAEGQVSDAKDWDTSYWNQACQRIAIFIRPLRAAQSTNTGD